MEPQRTQTTQRTQRKQHALSWSLEDGLTAVLCEPPRPLRSMALALLCPTRVRFPGVTANTCAALAAVDLQPSASSAVKTYIGALPRNLYHPLADHHARAAHTDASDLGPGLVGLDLDHTRTPHLDSLFHGPAQRSGGARVAHGEVAA